MDSLTQIQREIESRHACTAHYVRSVPIREMARDEVVWDGAVEVFHVDHARTSHCYAWRTTGLHGEPVIITLLGIEPVSSPEDAVRTVLAGVRAMERHGEPGEAEPAGSAARRERVRVRRSPPTVAALISRRPAS